MNDQDLLRYSRHILLDEIGIEGQERLLAATALVIGCGGLGAHALPLLAAACHLARCGTSLTGLALEKSYSSRIRKPLS